MFVSNTSQVKWYTTVIIISDFTTT